MATLVESRASGNVPAVKFVALVVAGELEFVSQLDPSPKFVLVVAALLKPRGLVKVRVFDPEYATCPLVVLYPRVLIVCEYAAAVVRKMAMRYLIIAL
jgi:hypothetical protein